MRRLWVRRVAPIPIRQGLPLRPSKPVSNDTRLPTVWGEKPRRNLLCISKQLIRLARLAEFFFPFPLRLLNHERHVRLLSFQHIFLGHLEEGTMIKKNLEDSTSRVQVSLIFYVILWRFFSLSLYIY